MTVEIWHDIKSMRYDIVTLINMSMYIEFATRKG